jgi:hypothetical protein
VITGFNTDIEHDGVVYHVQTEDKGLDSPLILSLVYAGGAILASKRSRYEDLIEAGFNEEALAQRLKRQHRLICAAINAGRIEDLKRMGARDAQEQAPLASPVAQTPEVEETIFTDASETPSPPSEQLPDVTSVPETQLPSSQKDSAYTVYDSRRKSPLGEIGEPETGVVLTILDEEEFKAGASCTIRVLVQDRSGNAEKALPNVDLSLKILGTAFRPQIYSVKTGGDGVAEVSAQIPEFTSGRAAILIRVIANSEATEMRRVIHPAK